MSQKYNKLKKIADKKDDLILSIEKEIVKITNSLQVQLYNEIKKNIVDKLDVTKGEIELSNDNVMLTNAIDKIFEKTKISEKITEAYGKGYDRLGAINNDYYAAMWERTNDIARAEKNIEALKKPLINELDRIAQANTVRNQLREYVLRSVMQRKNNTEFRKGFYTIINNSPETEGKLTKYANQFINDRIAQADRLISSEYGKEIQLTKFVYAGTIIETSRDFCIERVGKIFDINEIGDWKCDPNLPKPKGLICDDSYEPLIELGRYNCRHRADFVTNDIAKELNN